MIPEYLTKREQTILKSAVSLLGFRSRHNIPTIKLLQT
jgi:hypothetical protein